MNYFVQICLILLSAVIGYFFGLAKSFREGKQKAYIEILLPILKMTFHPASEEDEKEFSKALTKLWLYGNKTVTRKMENALSILHHPEGGAEIKKALQEAVVEMRKDIQILPWQTIEPEEVKHLYTRIIKK